MSFVLVNDSFFCSSCICFNNTSTSIRSFSFSHIYRKGLLSEFQPGAPHNLNPPLYAISDISMICYMGYVAPPAACRGGADGATALGIQGRGASKE